MESQNVHNVGGGENLDHEYMNSLYSNPIIDEEDEQEIDLDETQPDDDTPTSHVAQVNCHYSKSEPDRDITSHEDKASQYFPIPVLSN